MESQNELSLRVRIQQALHKSLKRRDSITSATLRLVLAAWKDQDIALRTKGKGDHIDEAGVTAMLRTMIKQRHESIRAYQQVGRDDRADMERKEIAVIQAYLPPQWDESTTRHRLVGVLEELKASDVKDMGRVMSHLRATYGDEVDMSLAGKLVRVALLNGGKLT